MEYYLSSFKGCCSSYRTEKEGVCHQSWVKTNKILCAQPHTLTYLEPNSLITQEHLLIWVLSILSAGSTGKPSSLQKVLWHLRKVGFTYLKREIYFNPEGCKERREKQHLQNFKEVSTDVEKDPKVAPSMKAV